MKTVFYLFLFVSLLFPQMILADSCTWLGGSGSWDDPAKWSCGVVPDADDDVIIGLANSITRTSPLTIQSLTITVNAALDINGDLTITGLFTWEAGQLKGSGNTLANGGVIFQGTATKYLIDRSLTLNANSTWSAGKIIIPQNLALTIASGVTFEITGDDILRPQIGNSGVLENEGTILKSAGAKTTFETVNFTNNGNGNVTAGTLEFRGCDSDGDFNITAPGILQLYQNTLDLNAGASISGSGKFLVGAGHPTCNIHPGADLSSSTEVTAGTVNINQDITLPSLFTGTSSAINFQGSGRLIVADTASWNGGIFKNLPAGVRFECPLTLGGSTKTVEACLIELAGNTVWSLGQIRLQTNGKIKNLATFTDALTSNQAIWQFPTNAVGAEFINENLYTKTMNGTTQINVPFDNNGLIMVNAGKLQVEEGTSNANISIGINGVLEKTGIGATQFSFQSGVISGNGQLSATGGSFLFEAGSNVNTNVSVSATGKANWITFFPDTLTSVTMNGGSIQTNSTLVVEGLMLVESSHNSLSGGGSLESLGGSVFSSSGNFSVTDASLILNSNTDWINGNIKLQTNGIMINKPGKVFTVNVPTNRSIGGTGIGQQFNNEGTLKKLTNSRLIFGSNVAVTNTGLIQGLGIYDFKSTLQNTGTFAPGLSPGEMTLAGNIVNNSIMNFELEESGGSTNFDEMPIRGTLSLGGALNVTSLGNVPPGDYTLIYCDSLSGCLSGTFNTENLPSGSSIEYTSDDVVLSIAGPLPVEFVDFYGRAETSENRLFWSTASETNTNKFSIERSEDGRSFYEIGFTDAAGYSSVTRAYEFFDPSFSAIAYYRLKTIDFDGSESLSNTIVIERKTPEIEIFPNPFLDLVFVNQNGVEKLKGIILNANGTVVWKGEAASSIDLSHLPTGLYLIEVFDDSGKRLCSKKLIKQRS